MGEGACILVLEELESARARGATIYAEVLGYGASNDAHHLAQPEPEATGVAAMIAARSRRQESRPSAWLRERARHSTPLGDLAETRALKQVFGDQPTTWLCRRRSRSWATASGPQARSRR